MGADAKILEADSKIESADSKIKGADSAFKNSTLPAGISDFSLGENSDLKYVQPLLATYKQDGIPKRWELIRTNNSVSIVLYHAEQSALIFVKQFRPAVFVNNPDSGGYTYELCAGLVDKDGKSTEEIAIEEVFEECGYRVENLARIFQFYSNSGVSGARQDMFFGVVSERDRVGSGGGVDDEKIELIYVKVCDLLAFLSDNTKPKSPSVAIGILWFLENKPSLR